MTAPDPRLVEAGARALVAAREDDVFVDPVMTGAHWDGCRDIYREDAATVLAAAQAAAPAFRMTVPDLQQPFGPTLMAVEFSRGEEA